MVTITVSGLHGVGKTTAAKKLADKFDLRYVSAGTVFRQMAEEQGMSLEEFSKHVEENPEIDKEIDQRTAKEAEKGNVLIDGRLSGWMAKNADVRILLIASLEARVQRITNREDRDLKEVKKETITREESEAKRYKKLYDIDVNDYSVFDIILNTESFNESEMVDILEKAVKIKTETD